MNVNNHETKIPSGCGGGSVERPVKNVGRAIHILKCSQKPEKKIANDFNAFIALSLFLITTTTTTKKIERSDKIQYIDEASKRTVLLRFMIMAVK